MPKIRHVGRGTVWQVSRINQIKEAIKAELAQLEKKSGTTKTVGEILGRIHDLAEQEEPEAQLRRYIYCMWALILHERTLHLKAEQVRRLAHLANAVLRAQRIGSSDSKLGFLYGDLHQVISQIHRRSGQQWQSAWEQELSSYSSKQSAKRNTGFLLLASGVRALRLGDARDAIDKLRHAETLGLSARSGIHSRLEQLKAFRLLGDEFAAVSLERQTLTAPGLSPDAAREIEWERLCRQAMGSGDISPLAESARRGKTHFDYSYLFELFLWMRVVKSREWVLRFPTLKSLARGLGKPDSAFKANLDFVGALELCYDTAVPFNLRLEQLGDCLAETSRLFAIDKELLFLAAATRWLLRNRATDFADLVYREYRAKSLRLTEGKRADVLGMLSDVARVTTPHTPENPLPRANRA